jgi:hypothetical protein
VKIGDRVQLTGTFLKSTGQQRGSEGVRKWIVVACSCELCAKGRFVAVNEPNIFRERDPEQSEHRHIATGNLMVIGAPPRASDFP